MRRGRSSQVGVGLSSQAGGGVILELEDIESLNLIFFSTGAFSTFMDATFHIFIFLFRHLIFSFLCLSLSLSLFFCLFLYVTICPLLRPKPL